MSHFQNLRRFSLYHAAGLCLSVFIATAIPAAAQTGSPAPLSADQAYKDMAAENFPAAIANFKRALGLDPANAVWRTDLAYAYLKANAWGDAGREFKAVYGARPDQLGLALELGYISQRQQDDASALRYFNEAAGSSDPKIAETARAAIAGFKASQLRVRRQAAYDLLARGQGADAVRMFETLHAADPSDAETALQLAYAYDAGGATAKARELFRAERNNADPGIAARANSALDEINRRNALIFADFYAAPLYQTRFSNQINPFNAKLGLRPSPYFQPYAGLRLSRDTRSTIGSQPEIYSDNSAVISAGVQSRVPRLGATVYAEAGSAIRLVRESNSRRAVPDYRTGMFWFQDWGTTVSEAALRKPARFSMTGSGYGDVSYYSRFDGNVIGYGQLRQGFNLPTGRVLPIQVLAALNYIQDSNKEFYNNTVEIGPAIRIAPSRHMTGVQLEAQYVHGVYTRHDPANPYGARYHDFRFSILWGKGFAVK